MQRPSQGFLLRVYILTNNWNYFYDLRLGFIFVIIHANNDVKQLLGIQKHSMRTKDK